MLTSVQTLNIPPQKVKQLEDRGIYTLEDLLRYFPKEYLDFSVESEVGIENLNKNIAVIGKLVSVRHFSSNKTAIRAEIETSNKMPLDVIWFNQEYLFDKLSYIKGSKIIVCGKLTRNEKYYRYSFINPPVFSRAIADSMKIVPVYKKVPGMSADYLTSLIKEARKKVTCKDTLSEEIKKEFKLCDYEKLFDKIHSPKSQQDINE